MSNGTLREPSTDEQRIPDPDRSPEQRYHELVDAVKRHEAVTAKSGTPRRPRDHELYRQLKSLEEFS